MAARAGTDSNSEVPNIHNNIMHVVLEVYYLCAYNNQKVRYTVGLTLCAIISTNYVPI